MVAPAQLPVRKTHWCEVATAFALARSQNVSWRTELLAGLFLRIDVQPALTGHMNVLATASTRTICTMSRSPVETEGALSVSCWLFAPFPLLLLVLDRPTAIASVNVFCARRPDDCPSAIRTNRMPAS